MTDNIPPPKSAYDLYMMARKQHAGNPVVHRRHMPDMQNADIHRWETDVVYRRVQEDTARNLLEVAGGLHTVVGGI